VYYRDTIRPDQQFMAATATAQQIGAFRLLPGDVIITKDSETPDDIGVPAFVAESAEDLICGYHLAVIRPATDRLDGRYLYWAMKSKPVRSQLSAAATGITRFGLRTDVVKGLRIPLPPLDEQRGIANYLDREVAKLNQLGQLKKTLVSRLPERLITVMHAAIASLSRNAKLGYVGSWLSGGTPPKDEPEHWSGALPWASTKDLSTDDLRDTIDHVTETAAETYSRIAPKGSVLVATRGMALAKRLPLAVSQRPVAFNQDLKALVPTPGIRADYLRIALRGYQSELLASVVESAHGTRRLETRHLKALRVPIPDLDTQSRIVKEVRAVEAETQAIERALSRQLVLLEERCEALITAAVTGVLNAPSRETPAVAA
jgi:type I restriction enzyme S subunit